MRKASGRSARKSFQQMLRETLRETWHQTKRAQLPLVASSLSYTTILSLVPLLALSFAVFQVYGGFDRAYGWIEPFIIDNLAEGVDQQVIDAIHKFISNAHPRAIGITGLIGLTVASLSMLSSVEKAINRVWDAPLRRGWTLRISSYLLFIALGPVAVSIALGITSSYDLPLTGILPSGAWIFAIAMALLFVVYKWAPHARVHFGPALFSAFLTTVSLHFARIAYISYLAHVVSYSLIYNSLAAVPIFILWIYIVWLVILAGAALTAALQHQAEGRLEHLLPGAQKIPELASKLTHGLNRQLSRRRGK